MNSSQKAGPCWSGFFGPVCLGLFWLLSSCQPSLAPSARPKPIESRKPAIAKSRKASGETDFVGLSKGAALARVAELKLRSRIVREDSQRYAVTKDMRPNRLNFEIDQGRVTSARKY